jgi:hypothetical protein
MSVPEEAVDELIEKAREVLKRNPTRTASDGVLVDRVRP